MRRPLFLISLVAVLSLGIGGDALAGCIKRHDVPLEKGTSPSGWAWSVEGTIGENGPCGGDWLFGMEFELEGAVNWGFATGIPKGGHLGRRFDIEASDDLLEDGSYRVVSGTVNGEVARVQFTLSNNKRLEIRPKSPSERLRRKVAWLRNVRYFVEYYPPVGFVTGVATFSRSGQLLYRDKSFEGP
ncbi:MAG TPA: hypothetical protein VFN18_05495 [Solirubrobacterales bacterium]|nr:hypothetical protein [Solirubrobacterales bacterium]